MATNLERYEILKRHLPEEAAQVIAETFPTADQLVTKDYLDARLESALRHLETSMHRWMLTLMVSLWLGMGGMIVAIVTNH